MKRRFGRKPFCAPWAPFATIGFISSLPAATTILQSVFFKERSLVALAILVAVIPSSGSDPFGTNIMSESLKSSGAG
eukprot:6001577-Pyramimonas_sp.AAC.1